MATITLYARQQKRHRCIEQSFGLCGRGRGWDDLGEWHWNMYIIICETNRQVQVWCMIQDARGWCTGMTQRDGMGREMGGGFRMGNTCTPMADSCQCMAKPLQCCKVIRLQLKSIYFFKKELILHQNMTHFILASHCSCHSMCLPVCCFFSPFFSFSSFFGLA